MSTETTMGDGDGDGDGVIDEAGVWSLQRFALDGTNWEPVDQMVRVNAFLLRFDAAQKVLAAATCAAGGSNSVKASICRIALEGDRTWECRCFSYAWTGPNEMAFAEFDPGAGPGDLSDPDVVSAVQEDPEVNGAALWSPLPPQLFDSGDQSRYQFLQKAEALFDESGCAQTCAQ